ncbi:hypothetical protein EVAR_38145_1 [Eumeta japonica]|uniref:Uncharacterized protein n=1 Tax=Eumeta variegata TaxID=151549 RepID=A0A4C1YSC0_EUMVA|nr:hypothetical protein EVAR_38145_1 [Eumeta japonica]
MQRKLPKWYVYLHDGAHEHCPRYREDGFGHETVTSQENASVIIVAYRLVRRPYSFSCDPAPPIGSFSDSYPIPFPTRY